MPRRELYLAALGWDDHFKIAYGAPLFANHLWPIAALAGADRELGDRIMAAFNETAERRTDALLAGEVPSVWAHMGGLSGRDVLAGGTCGVSPYRLLKDGAPVAATPHRHRRR